MKVDIHQGSQVMTPTNYILHWLSCDCLQLVWRKTFVFSAGWKMTVAGGLEMMDEVECDDDPPTLTPLTPVPVILPQSPVCQIHIIVAAMDQMIEHLTPRDLGTEKSSIHLSSLCWSIFPSTLWIITIFQNRHFHHFIKYAYNFYGKCRKNSI